MNQYTDEQLEEKIHLFLSRKFQQRKIQPDDDLMRTESKRSKRLLRDRRGILHHFMPTQLKAQF